jgi:hypothetical protein
MTSNGRTRSFDPQADGQERGLQPRRIANFYVIQEVSLSNSTSQVAVLDRTIANSRQTLRGNIVFQRGDFFQTSNIDIRIVSRSNDRRDLSNLHFSQLFSTFSIGYNFEGRTDTCTEVHIFVFLRPRPRPFVEVFNVWTTFSDVKFFDLLNWEINNMTVHSSHGNVDTGNRVVLDPLIVHNMSASSIDGTVFGE